MIKKMNKNEDRKIRASRVRAKISGTAERPRLNVFRSLSNIYAQVIDDANGKTVVSASSKDKTLSVKGSTIAGAEAVGKLVAERAIAAGVKEVVFDRSGYLYHGRVKAIAEAARKAGLSF